MSKIVGLLVVLLFLVGGNAIASSYDVQTLYLDQEYSSCIEACEAEIKMNRGSDTYYWFKGLSEIKLGSYKEARKTFSTLVKECPTSRFRDEALLSMGDTYLYELRLEEAYDLYKSYLSKSPGQDTLPFIYTRLATVSLKLGKWQEAKGYLSIIVRDYKGTPFYADAREKLDKKEFYFTLQVGAFADRSNAEKIEKELKSNGFPVYTRMKSSSIGVLHKVYVGRYESRSEAEKVKSSLEDYKYAAIILP